MFSTYSFLLYLTNYKGQICFLLRRSLEDTSERTRILTTQTKILFSQIYAFCIDAAAKLIFLLYQTYNQNNMMFSRLTLLSAMIVSAQAYNTVNDLLNKGCKWPCFRRRQLSSTSVTPYSGEETELQAHFDSCGEYEYEVSIFVDGHIHGVAAPKKMPPLPDAP